MHLEGPWLSTTGKRKGKKKFASAEHARKARELEESWKELLKRQGAEQEERKRARGLSAPSLSSSYNLKIPEGRNTTAHIKSVDTGLGNAVLKPSPVYTGTKVKGIATMHKSNAVPVFSDEEAVDISKMRR
jgi:CRISPR/Cas system CMR subunit Cmr6 (Cas7 group RAMP superfamily)